MNPRIVVLSGVKAGEVFVLPAGECEIGRDDKATLSLPDPLMSRAHAAIVPREDEYWIQECGSLNGTLVNGVALTRPTALAHGARIMVGETELVFLTED